MSKPRQKLIPLTQGKFAIVDDADFDALNAHRWCADKTRTGDFKARRWTPQGSIYMHREVLGLEDGKILCDHINHNGLDNRRENIRAVTNQQNSWNKRGALRGSMTGIRGVYLKRPGKWLASIKVNGVSKHLGYFDNIEDAKEAYAAGNRKYFGEFGGLPIKPEEIRKPKAARRSR